MSSKLAGVEDYATHLSRKKRIATSLNGRMIFDWLKDADHGMYYGLIDKLYIGTWKFMTLLIPEKIQ
jgi:hypothetical protein